MIKDLNGVITASICSLRFPCLGLYVENDSSDSERKVVPIPEAVWSLNGNKTTFPTNEATTVPAQTNKIQVFAEGYKVKTAEIEVLPERNQEKTIVCLEMHCNKPRTVKLVADI